MDVDVLSFVFTQGHLCSCLTLETAASKQSPLKLQLLAFSPKALLRVQTVHKANFRGGAIEYKVNWHPCQLEHKNSLQSLGSMDLLHKRREARGRRRETGGR